jgi:hypothetical protein
MGMKRIILVFGLMFVSICSINASNGKEALDELLEILSNEWREMKEILGITEEEENTNPTTPRANGPSQESSTENTSNNTPPANSTTNDSTSANGSFDNMVSNTTDNKNRDEKVSTDKSTNNRSSDNNKNEASTTKTATNDNNTKATKPIKSKEKKSTTHENSSSQQATQQKYETDEFQNIHELIEIEKKRLEKEITELEYLYNKKQEEMNRTYQSQKEEQVSEEQKTSSDKEESIIEKKEDKRAKRESERIGTERTTHLKFKGVPIDGSLETFVWGMQQVGFRVQERNNSKAILSGDFAGFKDCLIYVYTLQNKDLVSNIVVHFPNREQWKQLSNDYFNLKSLLIEKYGNPTAFEESFDDEYRITSNDDKMKLFYVKDDKCKFSSIFTTPQGNIILSIEHAKYNCFVMLRYIDKKNSEDVKKHAIDDL